LFKHSKPKVQDISTNNGANDSECSESRTAAPNKCGEFFSIGTNQNVFACIQDNQADLKMQLILSPCSNGLLLNDGDPSTSLFDFCQEHQKSKDTAPEECSGQTHGNFCSDETDVIFQDQYPSKPVAPVITKNDSNDFDKFDFVDDTTQRFKMIITPRISQKRRKGWFVGF
jgi:hypothetical protein